MKKTTALFVALLLIILPCCGTRTQKYQTDFFDTFDTYTILTVYAKNEEESAKYSELVHGELLRLHKLFDIYNDYDGINNLKTVNDNAGIAPVAVDASVIGLLERGVNAFYETDGAVNIALGPVLRIWHDCRNEALRNPDAVEAPSMEKLQAAEKLANINNIVIDRENGTVFLKEAGMSLDVGALAKGYAAQAATDLARDEGLESGLLNAGGNVVAAGKPPDGRQGWDIGVRSPDLDETGAMPVFDVVRLSDCAAVSSGDYERYFEAGGVRYHHIIDPETLFPAANSRAVTVIHPDSATADILSTAAFILPYERARQIVEAQGGQAIWIFADGTFKTTSGYTGDLVRFSAA